MASTLLRLAPVDQDGFYDRYVLAEVDAPDLTLRQLLAEFPAFSLDPLLPAVLDSKVTGLRIEMHAPAPDTTLYLPPSLTLRDVAAAQADPAAGPAGTGTKAPAPDQVPAGDEPAPVVRAHPEHLSEREAVLIAYATEIEAAAGYLKRGMSVLVQCEKLLVEHLAQRIATLSGRPARRIEVEGAAKGAGGALAALGGSRRGDLIDGLGKAIRTAVPGDIVVIPHLDLLGGGTDASLSSEGREITDLLYEHSDRPLLAFTDPSLTLPEVLASRFAVRIPVMILQRQVIAHDDSRIPIGVALVTREEAELFEGFDPHAFYKHVAGMNAVRLRHALLYALHQHKSDPEGKKPTFELLLATLRVFKRDTSTFELPNTPLDNIGGYEDVKLEIRKALAIINGAIDAPGGLSQQMRNELIPRGFIFHGPPGTGKTLFAKAIATEMGGTIQVVSGPEVTDMYVGESERKLRELFAQARRNAPAVLVFDEFDSIAAKRTGRDDGGSRAGNAVVAQLLTELDGFRPEVPVLIVGTTNRVDIIDEALLRPSRFREIKIGLPEEPEARKEIARIHASHFEVKASEELLDAVANSTNGMNGDEIRSIFRDAKANELVGDRRTADARVLGEMIGRLRQGQQSREAESRELSGRPGARAAGPARGARRGTPMTPHGAATSVSAADGEGTT